MPFCTSGEFGGLWLAAGLPAEVSVLPVVVAAPYDSFEDV
jgi:hypothetical protein